jgi:hypothetical protein
MSNRAEFDTGLARALDASDTARVSFLQAINGKLLNAGYHYNTNTLDWEANTGGTAAGADVNVTNFPANPATSTLQTTGNSSLSSIDAKTPALGQALAAASSPVVLTAAQLATLTPPAAITGYATEAGNLATIVARLDVAASTRLAEATFTTRFPVQGQAAMAASVPVAIASNQSAVPISAASLPLPTGAATDAAFVAANGAAESRPAAYTVMDRLFQIGAKLDALNATEKQVLAALYKPVAAPVRPTLLHGR